MVYVAITADDDLLADLVGHLRSPSWFDQSSTCTQEHDSVLDQIVSVLQGNAKCKEDYEFLVWDDEMFEVDAVGHFDPERFVLALVNRGVVVTQNMDAADQPISYIQNGGLDMLNEAVDEALQEACFGEVIYG